MEPTVGVQRQATSHESQRRDRPHARQWTAGATPRRLSSRIARPPCSAICPSSAQQRRRQRIAGLTAEIDDPHTRQRRADTGGELEPLQPLPALGARRRAAVDGDGALERGALGRDRARVVPRVGVLLVRGVVLLVEHDQTDVPHRREHRRARADDDAGRTGCDPLALVATLGIAERRMQDRDRVAEARTETPHRLRARAQSPARARSHHARARVPPRRPGDRPPSCRFRSARPGAYDHAAHRARRRSVPPHRPARRQRIRLRLAAQGFPLGRRRPLRPALRHRRARRARGPGQASIRSNRPARAQDRRAPAGCHRASADLAEDDALRRRDAYLRDDTPCGTAAEANGHDRALPTPSGTVYVKLRVRLRVSTSG